VVEQEEFKLVFRSSREFFFAPVIEYGPLADWKEIAGTGQDMQDTFWKIKAAIDAYFGGGSFAVTVRAGCAHGRKPLEEERAALVDVPPPPPTAPPEVDGPTNEIQTVTAEIEVNTGEVPLGTGEFELLEESHRLQLGDELPPVQSDDEEESEGDELLTPTGQVPSKGVRR
jgi:hypothetical protein